MSKDLFEALEQDYYGQIEQYQLGEIGLLDVAINNRKNIDLAQEYINTLKAFEQEHLEDISLKAKAYNNKYNGYQFEYRQGRKLYDFSQIQEVAQAQEYLKKIKEKYIIAYESRLNGTASFNPQTGEILPIPELKPTKSFLILNKIK